MRGEKKTQKTEVDFAARPSICAFGQNGFGLRPHPFFVFLAAPPIPPARHALYMRRNKNATNGENAKLSGVK